MHLITEAQTHEPLSKRICSGTVRNEKIILHSSMLRMWDLSSQIWNENQHVYVWCHKQDQYVWPKCILHHKANLLHHKDQYVWPKCILHHKANLLHHKDQYVWPKCILHHKANLLHHKDQYVWPKCILHHKANLLHHKDQYVWPKCILHHKANLLHYNLFWPLMVKSELTWLCPEDLRFKAYKVFLLHEY